MDDGRKMAVKGESEGVKKGENGREWVHLILASLRDISSLPARIFIPTWISGWYNGHYILLYCIVFF